MMDLTLDSSFYVPLIVLPLILPFVAGIVILVGYGKEELNRLIGFLTIKPVLAYPLWFYMTMTVETYWYDNWFDNVIAIFGPLLALIPAIILTIGIIYTFRTAFSQKVAWLFLGLDILRMLNTSILAGSDNLDFFALLLGLVLPSFIAILALVIVITRSKTVNSALSAK